MSELLLILRVIFRGIRLTAFGFYMDPTTFLLFYENHNNAISVETSKRGNLTFWLSDNPGIEPPHQVARYCKIF